MTGQQRVVSWTKKGRLGAGGVGFFTVAGIAATIAGIVFVAKKAIETAQKPENVQ